jgi:Flp pilus assembly pilin Flp
METENLIILIKLFAAHIIGDFIIQTDRWVKHKEERKLKSVYLYLHAFLHGLLAWLFIAELNRPMVPIIIVGVHLLIDIFKLYQKKSFLNFALDQFLHLLSLLLLWLIFYANVQDVLPVFMRLSEDSDLWVIGTAYVITFWPVSILIHQFTLKWQDEMNKHGDTSLPNAGKWIGRLERLLILTFMLINQFEAIGFLIAAKSVFRFGDLRDETDRKRTEYILIGTLISFTITIGIGLLVKVLINLK